MQLNVTDGDINGTYGNDDSIATENGVLATSITKARHDAYPNLTNLYDLAAGFFEYVFSRSLQTFLLFLSLTLYPDHKDLMNFTIFKILQDKCVSQSFGL